MSLAPGTRLGPYEIVAPIGAGGMGEVYRARDSKLKREVALKVLPDVFARDPDRMARFQREAELLAALNHPHIAAIYGLEGNALVMELVEGENLRGPLPLETAVGYACQIAEALEYAHEKGIVHRDLKPANVKITPEGVVKVLDFGLAKAIEDPATPSDPANSPTLTAGATRVGAIMGTAAYMSPEQASGKTADRRADIWSFGAVLFEMLTGKEAFVGESISDTLATVLKVEPDWSALPKETPASIRRLLRQCLRKDRKQRLQAIGDARIALENPERDEPVSAPSRSRLSSVTSIAAAVFAVALAALGFVHFREKPPAPAAPVRFQIQSPGNGTAFPFLSPDGRKLAFLAGRGRLWVHFLESGESRDLTVTNGSPFWSPDSRFIGYPFQNKLRKIEATGGPSQTVSDLPGSWGAGAWNQDDVIVFGVIPGGLFRVPAAGGVPVQITAHDPARQERAHYWPFFLPDGRHFVYIRASTDTVKSAIYLGSVDAKPEQQSSKPLVASNWGAEYAPSSDPSTGYLLFMREGTLMAQPFDNRRLELKGQAAPVADEVGDSGGGTGGFGAFSASTNDVLVFRRGATSDQQLTWYDREGKVLGTIGELGDYPGLALSPDGTRLAWSKRSGQAANIWLLDLSRGTSTRFTFGSAKDTDPVWSPDGSRIIFTSNNDLYQKLVSGVKDAEVLLKSSEVKHATSWSPDGRFLLYTVSHPKTTDDIWVLPLEGDKKPVPFLITEFRESHARFSPDGHWVAYTSDESSPGTPEVYVRSFSMNSAGTVSEASGKWQVSNGVGVYPRWRGDGRELYYGSPREGKVMAVEIATNPVFRHGKPQPLGIQVNQGLLAGAWDSTADGKRFLGRAAKGEPEPYTVWLNWQAGLKK